MKRTGRGAVPQSSSSTLATVMLVAAGMAVFLFAVPNTVIAALSDDDYYGLQRLIPVQHQLTNIRNTPSGSFTYEVPIVVPPGRSGLQPELTLTYSSQRTDTDSIYGYGWDLQIPYIERFNKEGTEKLYSEPNFFSSLSGELEDVSLVDGQYGTYSAKIEDGSYLLYEYASSTDSWTVTDKKGTQYLFGTGKANPHAATAVNGTTYTYDDNGNLTDDGTRTYSWNYNNTLASLTIASTTHTYQYDHQKQRVQAFDGTATTTYPNQYYNTNGTTKTKHIYAGNELVATLETVGTSTPTVRYIHTDHLGGTHVVTNASSTVVQVLDYYPFGSERTSTGSNTTDRHFIGERFDEETSLNYLNARYYESARGQFLSQDPTFLAVGGPDLADKMEIPKIVDEEKRQEGALRAFLSDPQLGNSYSYARNNPVTLKDPNGNCGVPCLIAAIFAGIFLDVGTAHAPSVDDDLSKLSPSPAATTLNVIGFITPGGVGKSLVGTSFGRLGTVVDKAPGRITGFTTHGLNQTINRGVSPSVLLDTTKNPSVVLQQAGRNRLFLTNQAAVVLNKEGQVVTTYTSREFQPHVQNVLKQAGNAEKKQ